jgi:hypothetical protein
VASGFAESMNDSGGAKTHRLRSRSVPVVSTAQIAGNRRYGGHGGTSGRRDIGRS